MHRPRPGARLRDIAASLGITERSAHSIITDLTQAGYLIRKKDGRRNRYQIQAHLPLPEPGTREPAVGEVLAVLLGDADGLAGPAGRGPRAAGVHVVRPATGPPGSLLVSGAARLLASGGRLLAAPRTRIGSVML